MYWWSGPWILLEQLGSILEEVRWLFEDLSGILEK